MWVWSDVKVHLTEDNGNNQNEKGNETSENGNETIESERSNNESSADPPGEAEKMETDEKTEAANNEEKNKDEQEKSKDVGERDLFRLVVVNSYGSQEIKKLVDDPKRPLSLTGRVVYCTLISDFVCVCRLNLQLACDWDAEVQEKCYDEEA